MLEFLMKGGVVMIPIALCSLVSLAIFLDRLYHLRRVKIIPPALIEEVEDLIRESKIQEAIFICRRNSSSMSAIILAGISNLGRPRDVIKETIEEVGRREVAHLGRFSTVLGTVASISPLLGLLGTVTGMIKVFQVISVQGVGNPGSLAGGISEAMITTASGLVVAIPTLVIYRYFTSKIDTLVMEMEENSMNLVELLHNQH